MGNDKKRILLAIGGCIILGFTLAGVIMIKSRDKEEVDKNSFYFDYLETRIATEIETIDAVSNCEINISYSGNTIISAEVYIDVEGEEIENVEAKIMNYVSVVFELPEDKISIIYEPLLSSQSDSGENTYSPFLKDKDRIVAGNYYIAVLDDEGSVKYAYQEGRGDYLEIEELAWENVACLIENDDFPVAISESGKLLVPRGKSSEELLQEFQEMEAELPLDAVLGTAHFDHIETAEKVEAWDALEFAVGNYPHYVLGVQKSGMLCEAGISGKAEQEQIDAVLSRQNVRDVAMLYGGGQIVCLEEGGSIYSAGARTDGRADMVSVEAGKVMIFGLTADGKVVHTEYPFAKDYSTENMHDIVFIAVGYDMDTNMDVLYGIRKDGKVVDHLGQEVTGFEDMAEIDVTLTGGIILGLNKEGQLVISEDADINFQKLVEEFNRVR